MPSPKIKICGISTAETLDAIIAARADYCGLNFFPPSPRHVDPRSAAELTKRAGGRVSMVGVFVDPDDAMLAQSVAAGKLDVIQLHGEECPARVAAVKARFGLPVWKVLPVRTAQDIALAEKYAGAADFVLFDTKTPTGSTLPGGMGLRFDWSLLSAYNGVIPWGLAGGLSADNVAEAITVTNTPMVDTSSGVESSAGVKDVDKIKAFCKAARNT